MTQARGNFPETSAAQKEDNKGQRACRYWEPEVLCFSTCIWDLKPVSTASSCNQIYLGAVLYFAYFSKQNSLKKKKTYKMRSAFSKWGQVTVNFYWPCKIKLSFLKMSLGPFGKGKVSKGC